MFDSKLAVIIPAAGKSSRFGDAYYKKPFIKLIDKAVWLHSAQLFHQRADVGQLILVISPEDRAHFEQFFSSNVAVMDLTVVEGGAERSDSVRNALEAVGAEFDHVAIHDAARPCLHKKWVDKVFAAGKETGAAILAHPIASTIKYSGNGKTVEKTVDRSGMFEAQTPQVFKRSLLEEAFAKFGNEPFTDEAQLVERSGHPVQLVDCSAMNIKLTTKADMDLAKAIMKALPGAKDGGPKASLDDLFG